MAGGIQVTWPALLSSLEHGWLAPRDPFPCPMKALTAGGTCDSCLEDTPHLSWPYQAGSGGGSSRPALCPSIWTMLQLR